MNHINTNWTRRAFVRDSTALLLASPLLAKQGTQIQWLSLRYRTDPESIARLLPPPLKPDVLSDVLVGYVVVTPPEEAHSLAEPGPWGFFTVHVAAKHKNRRGMLALGMVTDSDWPRVNAREFLGLNAKDGVVSLEKQGAQIIASCRRRGAVIHRIETTVTNQEADPSYWFGATGFGTFTYHYRLHPDWRQSLISEPGAELWKVGSPQEDQPEEDAGAGPRTCDISKTKFEWAHASALDPFIEFPVREFVGAAFHQAGAGEVAQWREKLQRPKAEFLESVPPESFRNWALLNYDRPSRDGKPWQPRGWRRSATALKLSASELESYAKREEMAFGPLSLVDIRIAVDPAIHAEVLPPLCDPGSRPILRILALRTESSELSPSPYSEIWLFAYCRINRQRRWYALSHVVGEDGDVIFGRETFGYPSVSGKIDVIVAPDGFTVLASRLGREFIRGSASFRSRSAGTSLSRTYIAGLRGHSFGSKTPQGELVEQDWFFQGRRLYAAPRSVWLELPAAEALGGIGKPTPWFEFTPFQIVAVGAMEDAVMQRKPGRIAAEQPDFSPYYRERCDGLLPGEKPPSEIEPTYRGQTLPMTRS